MTTKKGSGRFDGYTPVTKDTRGYVSKPGTAKPVPPQGGTGAVRPTKPPPTTTPTKSK